MCALTYSLFKILTFFLSPLYLPDINELQKGDWKHSEIFFVWQCSSLHSLTVAFLKEIHNALNINVKIDRWSNEEVSLYHGKIQEIRILPWWEKHINISCNLLFQYLTFLDCWPPMAKEEASTEIPSRAVMARRICEKLFEAPVVAYDPWVIKEKVCVLITFFTVEIKIPWPRQTEGGRVYLAF